MDEPEPVAARDPAPADIPEQLPDQAQAAELPVVDEVETVVDEETAEVDAPAADTGNAGDAALEDLAWPGEEAAVDEAGKDASEPDTTTDPAAADSEAAEQQQAQEDVQKEAQSDAANQALEELSWPE